MRKCIGEVERRHAGSLPLRAACNKEVALKVGREHLSACLEALDARSLGHTLGHPPKPRPLARKAPLPTARETALSRPRPSAWSRDAQRARTPYAGESIRGRGEGAGRASICCDARAPPRNGAPARWGRARPGARSVTACVPQSRASRGWLWCGRGPGHRGAANLQAAWPAAAARRRPPPAARPTAVHPRPPGRRTLGLLRLLHMQLRAGRPGAAASAAEEGRLRADQPPRGGQ